MADVEEKYERWLASLPKDEIEIVESCVRLRVKEVAREKGISMGKLHRAADVSYKTIRRIYAGSVLSHHDHDSWQACQRAESATRGADRGDIVAF